MVAGQRDGHDRGGGDIALGIDDGALLACADGQDHAFRRVDDGREGFDAEHARLEIENVPPVYSCGFSFRSRARAARSFISSEISARPLVSALKITGVMRPPVDGHGDRDIGVFVVGDALVGVAGVAVRLVHQGERGGLDQHVVNGDLHAFLCCSIYCRSRGEKPVDIEVDVEREMRHLHEALGEATRHRLAHAVEGLQLIAVWRVDAVVQNLRQDQAIRLRRCCRCCSRRGYRFRIFDIALDDPATRASAGNCGKVDAFYVRDPARQRARLDTAVTRICARQRRRREGGFGLISGDFR